MTRDHQLAGRRGVRALLITTESLDEQITEVRSALGADPGPFSRCAECNGILVEVSREEVRDRVPPYVWHTQPVFHRCADCGRIYWKGSHWPGMEARLEDGQGNPAGGETRRGERIVKRSTGPTRRHVFALGMALAGCTLYAATSAPSVATIFDDSLEFQVVLPTLGIAHPSGYPLYTLLGWLVTHLLPVGDPAGRANLFSALAAAAAVGIFFLLAMHVARNRTSAAIVTAAFAISPVWWSQATLAEVYALHGLFVVAFLYLLLRWEEATLTRRPGNDRWLALAALVAGLGMAHHRMIALLLPAALVLILWTDPQIVRRPRRWLLPLALGLAPLLLYLYLPLRGQAVSSLDGTYAPTPAGTLDWVLARGYNVFLTGNPFNVHRTAGFYLAMITDQPAPSCCWRLLEGCLRPGASICDATRF